MLGEAWPSSPPRLAFLYSGTGIFNHALPPPSRCQVCGAPAVTPVPRTMPGMWQTFKYLLNKWMEIYEPVGISCKNVHLFCGKENLLSWNSEQNLESQEILLNSIHISEHQWPRWGEQGSKITRSNKGESFPQKEKAAQGLVAMQSPA